MEIHLVELKEKMHDMKKALCIGIDSYESLNDLHGCVNDANCTSQQKLDTNFKYYLSINLISVQYGASFATFLSG